MASIKDTIAYILLNYPFKGELSNARLTKMVYLADWHHVLNSGQQVTEIQWYFDNYGPFVWDVKNIAEREKELFNVSVGLNYYGSVRYEFEIRDENYQPKLSVSERKSLDHVISSTKELGWDAFIKLVYSTYPIATSSRYSNLDLAQKARQYKP